MIHCTRSWLGVRLTRYRQNLRISEFLSGTFQRNRHYSSWCTQSFLVFKFLYDRPFQFSTQSNCLSSSIFQLKANKGGGGNETQFKADLKLQRGGQNSPFCGFQFLCKKRFWFIFCRRATRCKQILYEDKIHKNIFKKNNTKKLISKDIVLYLRETVGYFTTWVFEYEF